MREDQRKAVIRNTSVNQVIATTCALSAPENQRLVISRNCIEMNHTWIAHRQEQALVPAERRWTLWKERRRLREMRTTGCKTEMLRVRGRRGCCRDAEDKGEMIVGRYGERCQRYGDIQIKIVPLELR